MSAAIALIGLRLVIAANEFVEAEQIALIEDVNTDTQQLWLRLEHPLTVEDVSYAYAVASPRPERMLIHELLGGTPLGCSVTWVPRDQETRRFDLSWWRGGAAAITDIQATESK